MDGHQRNVTGPKAYCPTTDNAMGDLTRKGQTRSVCLVLLLPLLLFVQFFRFDQMTKRDMPQLMSHDKPLHLCDKHHYCKHIPCGSRKRRRICNRGSFNSIAIE